MTQSNSQKTAAEQLAELIQAKHDIKNQLTKTESAAEKLLKILNES